MSWVFVMILVVGFFMVVIVVEGRSTNPSDDARDVDNAPPPSIRSSSLFRDSHLLLPTVGPVISSSSSKVVVVRCTPMVEISTTSSVVLFVGVRVDLDSPFDQFARYELRGPARSVRFGLQQRTSVQKTEPEGTLHLARASIYEITVEDDSELHDTWKEDSGYVRLFYTHFADSPYWDVRSMRGNMANLSARTPMEFRLLDSATTEAHTLVVNHVDRINTFHPISERGYVHDGIRHIHLIPRTDTTTMWRTRPEEYETSK